MCYYGLNSDLELENRDMMMGFGFFIALYGVLLNVPLLLLCYFLLAKPIYKRIFCAKIYSTQDRIRVLAVCIVGIFIAIISTYTPGYSYFQKQCSVHEQPEIVSIDNVHYYYIDGVNPNGPFLELNRLKDLFESGDIEFIEGPNPFRDKDIMPYIRYRLNAGGEFEAERIAVRKSVYGFRKVFNEEYGVDSVSREIYQVVDGKILAKYKTFSYGGGPLGWLTRPFGLKSCPNPNDQWFSLSYKPLDMIVFNFNEGAVVD